MPVWRRLKGFVAPFFALRPDGRECPFSAFDVQQLLLVVEGSRGARVAGVLLPGDSAPSSVLGSACQLNRAVVWTSADLSLTIVRNNDNDNDNGNNNDNDNNQPTTNQPTKQPNNQTTKQPNNQTTKQPNNQTTKQPTTTTNNNHAFALFVRDQGWTSTRPSDSS